MINTLTPEEAITRVPQWAGVSSYKVYPLGGGITNRNYRVDVKGESFALRIAGENTELLGINREYEYKANLTAGRLGIAPEVVYFIKPEGYLVTRFITGRPIPPDEIRQPINFLRVIEIIRKVHDMPEIPGTFSVFRVVKNYTELAHRYNVIFPPNFDWLIDKLHDAETALMRDPFKPQPCHNDLLNENFISDGRIYILDWEYAGMGDIFFDLANFSDNHSLSDEQDQWLLESYFGNVEKKNLARLKIMKIASDFREAMWGLVQIGISKLEFDFRDYSDKHFHRLTENLDDPRWELWLKEIK